MRGTIYACFNMEDMMLTEYKRAAHLLSETRWQKDLRMIFYNIGATYLGIDRFQEAEVYLDKASGRQRWRRRRQFIRQCFRQ